MNAPAAAPFDAMPEPPRVGPGGHLAAWIGVENARGVLDRLLAYAEQCGPVARVTLGPVRVVLISDPDVAAEVLADPRANRKGAAYVLTRVVLDNVLLLNGEAWESHRRLYRQALRHVDAVGAARTITARYADRLAAAEGAVALDVVVNRLVGDVVGAFVAGLALTDDLEPHRRRVQTELAAVGIDLQCRPWAYLSPARWWALRRSVREVRRFFRAPVERRFAAPAPTDPDTDVLGGFLALSREGVLTGGIDAVADGVVNLFFTAHDVLASSAAWTLWLLARHPDVQERLRAGDDPGLLRRVVKEGLRLFPGYALFSRTTCAPMTIGGYDVPAGTMLIVSPFVTHRLERHWPDAQAFQPDRWLGRSTAPPPPTAREGYLPFGSGARGCLASHLAFPVLEAIVEEWIARVELVAPVDHDPGVAYVGTAAPRRGLPVQVRAAPERVRRTA